MDGGREKPVEGLSVTAVLGICILHKLEQLLSARGAKEGGRKGNKEGGSNTARDNREEMNVEAAFGVKDLHQTTLLKMQCVERACSVTLFA